MRVGEGESMGEESARCDTEKGRRREGDRGIGREEEEN